MRRRRRRLLALGYAAIGWLLAASFDGPRAEVLSLTVGVDSTCPYGVVG